MESGIEARQGYVRRGCTDVPCLGVFSLCMVALLSLLGYAFANGDRQRYGGLPDREGRFCGASAGVADKPYLFFCLDGSLNKLRWTSPICVADCPSMPPGASPSTRPGCPQGATQDYPTEKWAGLLCAPKDRTLMDGPAQYIWGRSAVETLLELQNLLRAWQLLAIAGVVAIMLSFAYLVFLETATQCLLYTGIITLVAVPGAVGIYCIYESWHYGGDHLPFTGDSRIYLAIGISGCFLSAIFACVALYTMQSVGLAINCIKATCECIKDMPTMLFEPLLLLLVRALIAIILFIGYVYLASCVTQMLVALDTAMGPAAFVDVQYTDTQNFFLVFYVVMGVWLVETTGAMSQFAISYAVRRWWLSKFFFRDKTHGPVMATCTGAFVGVRYHVGTFALGGFVIGALRLPRVLLAAVLRVLACGQNAATAPLCACCGYCVSCYDRFLRFMGKNAYMDVAAHGSNFCKAAYNAVLVLESEATSVDVLAGSTWLFQLTGLGGIAAAGAFVTHILCRNLDVFSNSESEYFVEDPMMLLLVSFLICMCVTTPLLMVFDQVSDTILYCHAEAQLARNPDATVFASPRQEQSQTPETLSLMRMAGGSPL